VAFEHLESPQKIIPAAATGATLTMTASWGTGTWVEVTAATAAAWLLSGISMLTVGAAGDTFEWEIEVGTGAGGAEAVVCTFRGVHRSSVREQPSNCWLPILLDNIANGVRVAIRGRKSTAANRTWQVKLHYYEKPVTGTVSTTAVPQISYPAAAVGASITPNASGWVNSAWAQLIASTPAALVVPAITVNPGVVDVDAEIDIGTGTVGNEVVVDTIRIGSDAALLGHPWVLRMWPPLDNIGSGVRVAVRLRKTGTDTTAWVVGMMAWSKPL
jgi:hypothetical protein